MTEKANEIVENANGMEESGKTVNDVFRGIVSALAGKYGTGEAKAMARIIFENLKGWSAVDIAIKANEHPTKFIEDKIDSVVKRLLDNEPIQYIFGNADFYGMKLKVTRDTLIPRPETAELVDIIVKENDRKDLRVIDLGTGSGCIAIALSRNLPFTEVTAVDISDRALNVARENAKTLQCNIKFVNADIISIAENHDAAIEGPYDIIVSNPPYIAEKEKSQMDKNVTEFEPGNALFVPDSDPLKFYKAELKYAEAALSGGGKIYFEINPIYAEELKQLTEKSGFSDVELIRDSFGKERFLSASKN